MAIWRITSRSPDREFPMGSWLIVYRNTQTEVDFVCGAVRGDTPISMLEEWVLREADPLDVLMLPTGPTLMAAKAAA